MPPFPSVHHSGNHYGLDFELKNISGQSTFFFVLNPEEK